MARLRTSPIYTFTFDRDTIPVHNGDLCHAGLQAASRISTTGNHSGVSNFRDRCQRRDDLSG